MRHHQILPVPRIRQARAELMAQGTSTLPGLDACVSRSWRRSLAAGLSPVGRISTLDNLSAPELQRSRAQHHDLISHSQPVMEYLLEQVANTQSMVILADPQGVLMHTMGDLDFLGKAERVALTSGAAWSESMRGTNAIGTALAERDEVEIHGGEHFLERNGFLTCAAAPILSSSGALMGILDISGDQRSRHPHTLGLVSTAARMIENSLLLAASQDQVLLMLHARPEGIGSIAQGLLVFSHDGWLTGANRRGLELLGLPAARIGGETWGGLFDSDWADLQARAARQGERPLALHTHGRRALFARVRMRAAPLRVLRPGDGAGPRQGGAAHAEAAAAAATAVAPGGWVMPSPSSSPSALLRLDTGDARWRLAADRALRLCDKDIPLLVLGESGVGKELFARAVHDSSARRERPFVAINCAAIPEHLIEAELFGYVPGAFTGAAKGGSSGRLREVEGGTLFLDEIGDMPLALQTRLLRVLQERRVTPVGSGESIPVQFALVCATHHRLKQAVVQGRFRADLYYRINGLTLQLPALRERTDLSAVVRRLLAQHGGGAALDIDPELFPVLAAYPWPGNLRQLSHVVQTAVALLEPHQTRITWAHLPDDLAEELHAVCTAPCSGPPVPPPQNLEQLARDAMHRALENCRGNVAAAARQLGISRQTMYRRMGRSG